MKDVEFYHIPESSIEFDNDITMPNELEILSNTELFERLENINPQASPQFCNMLYDEMKKRGLLDERD
jgi:hypothetical protein